VVVPDGGYHWAWYSLHHISGIKTCTNATLNDGIIDLFLGELEKGYHGDDAEKAHEYLVALDDIKYLFGVGHYFFLTYLGTVDYHALTEGVNVRGGEQPSFET